MRKLPVFAALSHTISLTFRHLGPAFRVSWAWIVVLIVAAIMFVWVTDSIWSQPSEVPDPPSLTPIIMIFMVAMIAAMSSIAVAWHRYILMDEGGKAAYNLRADRTVWRYAGHLILIGLGFMLVFALPFGLLMAMSEMMFFVALPAIVLMAPSCIA